MKMISQNTHIWHKVEDELVVSETQMESDLIGGEA